MKKWNENEWALWKVYCDLYMKIATVYDVRSSHWAPLQWYGIDAIEISIVSDWLSMLCVYTRAHHSVSTNVDYSMLDCCVCVRERLNSYLTYRACNFMLGFSRSKESQTYTRTHTHTRAKPIQAKPSQTKLLFVVTSLLQRLIHTIQLQALWNMERKQAYNKCYLIVHIHTRNEALKIWAKLKKFGTITGTNEKQKQWKIWRIFCLAAAFNFQMCSRNQRRTHK